MGYMIKHYMIPLSHYPSINKNAPLEHAVDIMYHHTALETQHNQHYWWIIVTGDNGDIAGFITIKSLFTLINNLSSNLEDWRTSLPDTSINRCIQPLVKVFVRETDSPERALQLIFKHRITILPVINEKNEITGIVRPVDLVSYLRLVNLSRSDCELKT